MIGAALIAVAVTVVLVSDGRQDGTLPIGAPGEVMPAFVKGAPVFVVHPEDGDPYVLTAISPHVAHGVRKAVVWCPPLGVFVDPWHGSKFGPKGAWLAGPAPTGLGRYETTTVGDRLDVGERLSPPPRGSGTSADIRAGDLAACDVGRDGSLPGRAVAHEVPGDAPTAPSQATPGATVYLPSLPPRTPLGGGSR